MPENRPLVSLITINYNQLEVTCELLDSLRKISYPNYEIIIVDNKSKVNPKAHLEKHYPEAKVIVSDENLGFSGGNNIGIRASKGDYLFFINNDTELSENVIEQLLELFDKIPNLGMVSPKLCYYPEDKHSPDIIQYVGATNVNPYTARNTILGEMEEDKGQYTEAKPTPYAHGAAMMVPREIIDKLGMMPEDFFLYYEELDWCEQIRRAGYKIYVEPNALVYHKESMSVGKMSTLKTYYLTRNRILFMRRNRGGIQVFIFTLFLLFFTIPKNMLMYLIKGDFQHMKAFLNGIFWHVSNGKSNLNGGLTVSA